MDTIKIADKGNIKMIAHRGVSGLELENTCPAFLVAATKSYWGIETDVHVTKDGKFIIIHDDDLKRIAGLDWIVEESNFDDLRAIRLKDNDGTERKDLFLPTLEEYIIICRKYGKQAVLELKSPIVKEKVWEIADVVKQMGWFERTTFISFHGENLVFLRERYPDADAQFLTEEASDETFEFMVKNKFDADLCGYCITKEFVDRLHAAGLKVNVWTLDLPEHAAMAKAVGVDFITTDILE